MNINLIKQITTAICCFVLSHGAYSVDELYDSEISGVAYFNIPFGSNVGHASPTFGFAIGQTPTKIAMGSEIDPNLLLRNPTKRAFFDIQYELAGLRWSRFAFGGINALVYDDVLHADGGGPTIDPNLAVLGLGFVGFIIFIGSQGDDNNSASKECESNPGFTSNAAPSCCEVFTLNSQPTCCETLGFTSNLAVSCPAVAFTNSQP